MPLIKTPWLPNLWRLDDQLLAPINLKAIGCKILLVASPIGFDGK